MSAKPAACPQAYTPRRVTPSLLSGAARGATRGALIGAISGIGAGIGAAVGGSVVAIRRGLARSAGACYRSQPRDRSPPLHLDPGPKNEAIWLPALLAIAVAACAPQPPPPMATAITPPAPPASASAPALSDAQVAPGRWNVERVRCADLLSVSDEDRAAAAMFYYGYSAAKSGIHIIDVARIDANVAKVMSRCAATPNLTVPQAFRQALGPRRPSH